MLTLVSFLVLCAHILLFSLKRPGDYFPSCISVSTYGSDGLLLMQIYMVLSLKSFFFLIVSYNVLFIPVVFLLQMLTPHIKYEPGQL